MSNYLYVWGSNDDGQLGSGDLISRCLAREIYLPESIRSIGCGAYHTVALAESGAIYAWGSNSGYQLGLGRF